MLATFLTLFWVKPVFATTISTPNDTPSEIQINQTFSFNTALTNVQSGETYFVKCRLGESSTSLAEGQTYNSTTNTWLSDTGSTGAWVDMPTVTISDSSITFSIQCRVKSGVATGQKILYSSACLKKTDGTCGSGTSFKSASGINFTATAEPTPTPTPSSTPSPTPSSSSSSQFTISDTPSQIDSGQSFTVNINLSIPGSAGTDYYLKGAFKKSDGTRYLGLTKKDGGWVGYHDDDNNQNKITTDSSGNWSGSLEVKPDISDTDYKGAGSYTFKVVRITSGGSTVSSSEVTIIITDSTATPPLSPTPTPKASATPLTSPTIKPNTKPALKSPTPALLPTVKTASVAGVTITSSPTPSPTTSSTNPFVWGGLLIMLAGFTSLGYIYWKNK